MKTKIQLFALLILGLFLFSSADLFGQKANFSGSWTLNESKSNLGDSQYRGALKITVTQDDNSLTLMRVSKGRDDEDRTTNEKYALDGSESQNTAFMNTVRKSKCSWSADGKILTIKSSTTFERDGEKREFNSTEAFSLSPDGKNLTIVSTFNMQNGEVQQTRVYDKM